MQHIIKINRGTKTPPKPAREVNAAAASVYDEFRVWGTGNPRTTGATRGEPRIISRRNISAFGVLGTAR